MQKDILLKGKQGIVSKPEKQLITLLSENIKRNQFFKKEVLLIAIMLVAIFTYLFALNNWNNIIAFTSLYAVLLLVSLKLYHTFQERANHYNAIFKTIFKSGETTNASSDSSIKENDDETSVQNRIYEFMMFEEDLDIDQVSDSETTYEKKSVDLFVTPAKDTLTPEDSSENSPISDLTETMRQRIIALEKTVQLFDNYFKTSNIDDLEKEPAYKRLNIEIDDIKETKKEPEEVSGFLKAAEKKEQKPKTSVKKTKRKRKES